MLLSSLCSLYRLRINQWRTTSELEEIQRQKLVRIIRHAYEKVPYYHRLFDSAGVAPDDIRTVDDLRKIPVTTKSRLQELPPDEFLAGGVSVDSCIRLRTSGSTGKQLDIFLSQKEKTFLDLVWARAYQENGLKLRDRRLVLRSFLRPDPPAYWFEYLGIMRRKYEYLYDESTDTLETIRRIKPEVIVSYPSLLKLLALELKQNPQAPVVRPRAVFTRSELLNLADRDLINAAFGVTLSDMYGSQEFGCMAWECERHEGYHMNIDTTVIEFIKDGKTSASGERGKLICTALHSYTMPLIRYELGDVGVPACRQCSCGRGLPLLENLEGRSDGFVQLPGDIIFTAASFSLIMRDIEGIKQYRIEQEKLNELTVYIEKGRNFSSGVPGQIEATITKHLDRDIRVIITIVDSIPTDQSGKLRAVVSKLPVTL